MPYHFCKTGGNNKGCERLVLIGFLAKSMDVDQNVWTEVIKETVPPKFLGGVESKSF